MIKIKNYFKGWYFKCCTQSQTIAFIPAYHSSADKTTASLQIITGNEAYNLPFDSLKYNKNNHCVEIGNCLFSSQGIRLDVHSPKLIAYGKLTFDNILPIRYDIMGVFRFVPFMQCRHSVYSMKHLLNGQVTINGQKYNFCNGIGYIEGDSGTSFPNRYIWTQCSFNNGSLMLSVADIPYMGFSFVGIIGIVLLNGKEYRLATYLGAKIERIGDSCIKIRQGDYSLTAKLIEKNSFPLFAPQNGKMNRTIHESASCKAFYQFLHKDKVLCEFTSDMASFEYEFDVNRTASQA